MLKTYTGGCHCGAVRFEAEIDFDQGTFRCNCSICRQTRFWAAVARADAFRVQRGEDALTEYRFGSRSKRHFFCRHCGVRPFGRADETPVGPMVGVNVGCIDGLSDEALAALQVNCIDGRADRFEAPTVFSHL